MSIADLQPDEAGSQPIAADDNSKSHPAFSRLKRELSDDELASPGVQKLLLDYLARAEDEIKQLKSFRDRYIESYSQNGILNERLKTSTGIEVISVATLTIGAAIAGAASSLWKDQPAGWLAIAFGAILVFAGIMAKVVRR